MPEPSATRQVGQGYDIEPDEATQCPAWLTVTDCLRLCPPARLRRRSAAFQALCALRVPDLICTRSVCGRSLPYGNRSMFSATPQTP